jgi:hypothetical protein
LEKKSNYDLITGKAAKGLVVAGKKVKKLDAYKSLAEYVNGACKTQWDHLNAKSRYDAYLKNYKEAARESHRTGFGISEEDEVLNIRTIEEKLEHMCPYFSKMDVLFGDRQNVNPANVQEMEASDDLEVLATRTAPWITYGEGEENVAEEGDMDELELVPSTSTTPNSKSPWIQSEPATKKKDFSSSFLESKAAEIQFKKECFQSEMDLKQSEIDLKAQELDLKREELSMRKKESQTPLINTLITQGKTAAEIKEFLAILSE